MGLGFLHCEHRRVRYNRVGDPQFIEQGVDIVLCARCGTVGQDLSNDVVHLAVGHFTKVRIL